MVTLMEGGSLKIKYSENQLPRVINTDKDKDRV